MSQVKTTIGSEGMEELMKKQLDDMSQLYILTTNGKENQINLSKHVDTNATINQSLVVHIYVIRVSPKKNVIKKGNLYFE